MNTFDAILPAGGRLDPEFATRAGVNVKALIDFGGETMMMRSLRVLRESGRIRRTVVIGGEEVRKEVLGHADEIVAEGRSGPENILLGLRHLLASPNPPAKVFVMTTDLPLVEASTICDFLDKCPPNRDISVPLVSKSEWLARFPNSSATFATLADGAWTTGCAYLIDVRALESSMPHIERVFDNRKSIFGMAKLLGPKFLFKLLTKTLTVPDVETKIQSMLGCTGAAIRNAPPELSYDIDDLEDYEYALEYMKKGGAK